MLGFADEAVIEVRSGNGGNGCVADLGFVGCVAGFAGCIAGLGIGGCVTGIAGCVGWLRFCGGV